MLLTGVSPQSRKSEADLLDLHRDIFMWDFAGFPVDEYPISQMG
jgi:hypothetical protein